MSAKGQDPHNDSVQFDLPCRKRSLLAAREEVEKFAASHGFVDDAEDIALATQEALQNIIRHACPIDDRIHFKCSTRRDRMVVEVTDQGQGFDVEAAETKQRNPMAVHGRGLKLIRGLMDNVRIESDPEGTVVHMEKLRKRA